MPNIDELLQNIILKFFKNLLLMFTDEAPGTASSYVMQSNYDMDIYGEAPDKMTYTEQANKRTQCKRLTWCVPVILLKWNAFLKKSILPRNTFMICQNLYLYFSSYVCLYKYRSIWFSKNLEIFYTCILKNMLGFIYKMHNKSRVGWGFVCLLKLSFLS